MRECFLWQKREGEGEANLGGVLFQTMMENRRILENVMFPAEIPPRPFCYKKRSQSEKIYFHNVQTSRKAFLSDIKHEKHFYVGFGDV